jgi:hypothetical protein
VGSGRAVYQVLARTQLAEHLALPAGASKDLPFELTVPAGAVPTTKALHTSYSWTLVATGTKSALKRDEVVALAVNVHYQDERCLAPLVFVTGENIRKLTRRQPLISVISSV